MAETFLFNIAAEVLEKLGSLAVEEVKLAWGVKSELEKLKSTISTIHAVLLDAEEQQAKNHQLTDWLGKMKDALYDADDVLDEFQCEELWRQAVKGGGLKKKVRNFFSHSNPIAFSVKMGHKIKEVREKLDDIAAEKAKFHLTERFVDRRVMHGEREMAHSFVRASDVIGRDGDKEKIVQLLMRPHDGHGEDLSIIPIVGIGGLGKTTFARLVYNDEQVSKHFDLKMWVCVSDDFDVAKLMKEIYKSAIGGENSNNDLTIDQLQTCLRSTLANKKYLLIMDDVWNDELGKWVELRDFLSNDVNGSKIIVTTRSQYVASMMGTVPTYNLKGLSHEYCLSLFIKWAFKKGEDKQHLNLLSIGDEIVKKCGGIPLAVKTLGSMLYLKTDERDWLSVRDNEIWKIAQKENYILAALRLSYDQMPSYLKQCFAYCSIFPKDLTLNSYTLTYLWNAQGFLRSSNENEDWVDIGHQYVKEFALRSFFQDFEHHSNLLKFKMHDLVHDLALSVAQSECLSIINSNAPQSISRRIRHLSFQGEGDVSWETLPRFLLEQNNVRTIFFSVRGVGPTCNSFVETCISKFRCIRVLHLSDSSIQMFPSSIGKLKHLRYLYIAYNRCIKNLPSSICKLQNLQVLSLRGCSELEELPRDIGNLINLRGLEITTKQIYLPKESLGSLMSLRDLSISECGNLKSFGEWMQYLTTLRTLWIKDCKSLEESLLCCMKYLTNLETLGISNNEKINLMEREGDNIQGLKFRLRLLHIRELPQLVALPQWLQGAANTLQSIIIIDCQNLATLPEWLQNLTLLQTLVIRGCPELSVLPEGMRCLTKLTDLRIYACPELSRRCQRERGEDWPKIQHVQEIIIDGETIKSIYN